MSKFPKPSENNTTLGEAWITLTTVATPLHTPVQQLTTSIAQYTTKPHQVTVPEQGSEKNQGSAQVNHRGLDPDSYDPDHRLNPKQAGINIDYSGFSGDVPNERLHNNEPTTAGQGSRHLWNEYVGGLSKKEKLSVDSPLIQQSVSIKAKPLTRTGYQTSSQVFPKQSLLDPNPHLYPLKHAYSDKDIRITSVQTLGDSPPSSPGKLAMKYMEHLDSRTLPPGHRSSVKSDHSNARKQGTDLFAPPSESQQRRLAASPAKATALVAPYIGDSDTSTRIQNMYKTLESTLPPSGKLNSMSTSSSTGTGSKHEVGGSLPLVQAPSVSADKWKSLVETKNHILSQKNHLIERQKQTITYLQEQVKESEARVHLLMTAKAVSEGGTSLNSRLKELEYKNASSKATISELQSSAKTEVDTLTRKLDAVEYELHKKTIEFSQQAQDLETENKDLRKHLVNQQTALKEIDEKLQVSSFKNKELGEHIVKLNGYFENMPTMEEHQALKEQAQHCNRLCASLTSQLSDKETLLNQTVEKLAAKEEASHQLEQENVELNKQLNSTSAELAPLEQRAGNLEGENRKLVRECQRLQKLLFEADTHCRSELQSMRERHKERFMEATADLRSKHKMAAKRIKLLETQLLKNSDAMMALNSELQLSQGTIGQLKSSARELISQNQQLVEKNVSLQEVSSEASKLASALSEGQIAAAQQLTLELTQAIEDFESLINLSTSLMEGCDPCASLILGVRDGDSHSSGKAASESEIALAGNHEERLQRVRKLQQEINRLREIVSDQFATQVSSACHVQ